MSPPGSRVATAVTAALTLTTRGQHMRICIAIAAAAALSGCSQQEAAPAPEASEAAAATPTAAALVAADGKPSTGMFKITREDGTVFTEEVKADGTYVSTDATGKVVETGRWEQRSPTVYCTTKDEEGAQQICHTEGVDAEGVWTSTDPEGKTGTVERIG